MEVSSLMDLKQLRKYRKLEYYSLVLTVFVLPGFLLLLSILFGAAALFMNPPEWLLLGGIACSLLLFIMAISWNSYFFENKFVIAFKNYRNNKETDNDINEAKYAYIWALGIIGMFGLIIYALIRSFITYIFGF
jgi:hypothetical protein